MAGRIAADLARHGRRVVGVRVGGPNAGHTVLGVCPEGCGGGHDTDRHPWRLRQVPVSAVTAPNSDLVIAQGSEIDPDVLVDEIEQLNSAGYRVSDRLAVDLEATVIVAGHRELESAGDLTGRLGSTAKGIGAARSSRIWRTAATWDQFDRRAWPDGMLGRVEDTALALWRELAHSGSGNDSRDIVIEGTQGYGLGLHAGFYPFCTSGDCRAVDFLAQAGISPWQGGPDRVRTVVCLRPYPIRVAGNSGPMYRETDWESLGLPQELTTVTQKVRRVGRWDAGLAKAAMRANGAPSGSVWAALTMADQILPSLQGQDQQVEDEFKGVYSVLAPHERAVLQDLHSDLEDGTRLAYVGTGPDTAIVDSGLYA